MVLLFFEILFQDKAWSWSCLKFNMKRSLDLLPILRLVLVFVLTEIPIQDNSLYWSQTNLNFKTSLDIGLEIDLKSKHVLVLNKISGRAELCLNTPFNLS